MRPGLLILFVLTTAVAHAGVKWDFEDGTLQGWRVVEGDLGAQPTNKDDDRYGGNFGKQGKWFIGTYEVLGDAAQGELRSPVFTITAKQMALLVGGGDHPNEVFVALVLVEGDKEICRATGHNAEAMSPVIWDVSADVGKQAYVRAVDHHAGGWGHINLDNVRELTDEEIAAARRAEQQRKDAAARHYQEWRASLTKPAARTVYRGDALKRLTMTMGGIGAGSVVICGDGAIRSWQVCNNYHANALVPYGFMAVAAQEEGKEPVARVLQTAPVDNLPCVQSTEFIGEFPFGMINYQDEALPIKVSLECFSPLTPMEAKDSALPAVYFVLHAKNPTARPINAAFMMSLQNFVGWDGLSPIDGLKNEGYGGNVTQTLKSDGQVTLSMGSSSLPKDDRRYGTLALSCLRPEASTINEYADAAKMWSEFPDGFGGDELVAPSPKGSTYNGAIACPVTIPAGQEVAVHFVLAWHFPNRFAAYDQNLAKYRLGNFYATRFADAAAVAKYAGENYERLSAQTHLFRDTFYDSNLPYWFTDCVSSQISTLCSQTCLWIEDGTFHAFEGAACCPMNCTHVWNYEQTLAHLFPELERNMRHTDLFVQQDPSGYIHHRTVLPLSLPRGSGPFTDGHLSTISKAYREYRLSADDGWLKESWPRIKLAMDWAIGAYDADGDGVIQTAQPNTYDCTIFGANTFIGTQWLAALRAAEEMARVMGDAASADRYQAIFAKGSAAMDKALWNGQWWVQDVDLREHPQHQYGTGCHSDQLLGQWWANVNDLGYVLPREREQTALRSIFRHNFLTSFEGFKQFPRVFASDDEMGLICCSWPLGGRPPEVTLYSDEVWTGIEYEVAALMLHEGLTLDAYQIIKGARDRYNGTRRSPWNEIECGDHYARAMSSYSLLLAAEGYHYDGPAGVLRFAPTVQTDDFRAFFSGAEGWGTFSQKRSAGTQTNGLRLAYGNLSLTRLDLGLPAGRKSATGHVTLNGKPFPAATQVVDATLQVRFSQRLQLKARDTLAVTVSP